ncbi:Six-hairpin glycosidase [Pseudovirgaria hyperparasitica]|uniref:Six-hairpin glycosidase n=1 Tax=Pseudovirgaria hyperparasitica TaxID=470096 RepID=A0A6A6WC15_9PEZI|nr:Six-hairpin glycosidase [Pseudovirgaria hyperparasitica]KAF2760243.1 Six-hairpin glycosidase [Pseudovirgaria hyperparasitica]
MLAIILFWNLVHAQTCWRDTICSGPPRPLFQGPWESNIYAPNARIVQPDSIVDLLRNVDFPYESVLTLEGNGSTVVVDFGIEVGGTVSFHYNTTAPASIGLAFSEARNWIGQWSDFSNGGSTPDGAIYADIRAAGQGIYNMPEAKLRGGFRYLTIFLKTDQSSKVTITNITLEISFQPTWSSLRAYQGYFHSNDDQLNKIWYSGAYTLQSNSVPPNTGRTVPFVKNTWSNTGLLSPGDTVIVDGAKRDRAVWPGDMGIAVPSTFVSVGDMTSVKNALQVMYDYQNPDGSFPEAGPPLLQQDSDTYHMWTLIGTYNYVLYTDDMEFLERHWVGYLHAMEYVYSLVTPAGLLNVTGIRDWAREAQGGNNTEANIILYHTLQTASQLATWINDATDLSTEYTVRALALRTAINANCFDDNHGLFRDNATATTLYPQDANSMAILFNATTLSRASSISKNLLANWTPIGALAPELPHTISPFISSFEIQAHFAIGETLRGLDLIRRCWGWYLANPNGTQYNRGYVNPSYTSHAHGWSSGPTSALTEYVLGLRVQDRAGRRWSFRPQFGDLEWVEGGFGTRLGRFRAAWRRNGEWGFNVEVECPEGTTGVVELPVLDDEKEIMALVDGLEAEPATVLYDAPSGKKFIRLEFEGGFHSVEVS